MKLILLAAVSVDGKIAKSQDQNSLVWTSKEDTHFFVQKTKEIGVLIMGRRTFDTIGRPLKDRLIVVMTRSLEGKEQQMGMVEYTDRPSEEIIKDLEKRGYAKAAICGGSSVYSEFLQKGLVDEIYLTVEPIFFGEGVPIAKGFENIKMELMETILLNKSTIVLHYNLIR